MVGKHRLLRIRRQEGLSGQEPAVMSKSTWAEAPASARPAGGTVTGVLDKDHVAAET